MKNTRACTGVHRPHPETLRSHIRLDLTNQNLSIHLPSKIYCYPMGVRIGDWLKTGGTFLGTFLGTFSCDACCDSGVGIVVV